LKKGGCAQREKKGGELSEEGTKPESAGWARLRGGTESWGKSIRESGKGGGFKGESRRDVREKKQPSCTAFVDNLAQRGRKG